MGEDGISPFVHPRGLRDLVISEPARCHTLLDIVIADPTRVDLVARAASVPQHAASKGARQKERHCSGRLLLNRHVWMSMNRNLCMRMYEYAMTIRE